MDTGAFDRRCLLSRYGRRAHLNGTEPKLPLPTFVCTHSPYLLYFFKRLTGIGETLKDMAQASAGVSPYGCVVDGTVDVKPVTTVVEAVDEVADAGRGVNAYGTNVDNKMGGKLEGK